MDYVLLVTLAAIWGASFLFIKVTVATVPPATLVAARLALGAVGLVIYLWAAGLRLPRDPLVWRDFGVIAVIGNIMPFLLISWGEVTIDSGLAAILMGIMPLTTLLLAHVFTADDRLTIAKSAGVAVGFGGVIVLVGPGALAGLGREVLAQIAVAAAACCYAASSVYTRRSRLTGLPPASIGAGVLLCSAVLAAPIGLAVDRPWTLKPSAESIQALLVLSLVCTSGAYLILFRLLVTTPATFVSFINYMVPLFGVFWGALFLEEALPIEALAALGLILLGVGLAQLRPRQAV